MRNKLRFFAVIIVICFLFYMRNDPQDAKMQANQISQDIASSLRENLTEENVTSWHPAGHCAYKIKSISR